MDFIRPALPPIHVDTSLFRGGQKARDSDIFIVVMGLTGSGKSTNSTNVYLVDTPGFDDTNLSDSDVLKEIATWLTGSYNNEVKLTGILYLHRITDPRMGGSARKNLFMFKKLCGPEALKHVVLVTTMWELVDEKTGLERQTELETTEDFWGYMLSKGSRIEKHMNNPQSAHHIISRFMSHYRPTTPVLLAIQDEMVNKNKNLDETEAGKGLEGVLAKERERFKRDLDLARQEMQEAIAARDKESQEELMRQQALAERNLERLRRQQEEIKTTMEKLHREKYEKLEADWKKMEAKNNKKEAQWVQEKEELNGKITSLSTRMKKSKTHGQCEVEAAQIPAWDRTTSLSIRGQDWAFIGPYLSKWSAAEEISKDITSISKGDGFRIKKLVLGDGTDSYFTHYHTGYILTRCNYHGRVQQGYPGLYEFLNSKRGTECPKSLSLGPEGSYFIATRKKSSFKCHRNAEIDFQAGFASRIWWGFEGSYVMEMQDTTMVVNLRGHYATLGETLLQKTNVKIKELAMDIHGGKAFALIMEDKTVKFETSGEDSNWDVAFKEYVTVNFGLRWA
ncbi:hypothetical protein CCHR01_05478 [Colletotrichum chrysophilum]|uniref:AIG1-type G domain-containing protein n=2 Tax=Colletotrichum chrysophilum TaxID=1836956 RepID=A0AAD9EKP4_9PEZI|nr:hypothetical protein CCHR01_05478 [Colletotrichum chrysophilum]